MDQPLRNARKEDSVILRGGNCDGHDYSTDSLTLVKNHEAGVVYALYGPSWHEDESPQWRREGEPEHGIEDFSYCWSFKEEDLREALEQLHQKHIERKAAQAEDEPVPSESYPHPEGDPHAIEPDQN